MLELWRPEHSGAVAEVLCVVLLAYSVLFAPWLSNRMYNAFLARVASDPGARMTLYRRFAISQAIRLAVCLVIALAVVGSDGSGLIPTKPPWHESSGIGPFITGGAIGLVVGLILQQRVISRGRPIPGLKRVGPMLPQTSAERRLWAVLSVGAGTSEELLFRGLIPALLVAIAPSLSLDSILVIQAVAFGMAHLYQRWIGVLGTGILGYVLGSIVLVTGHLWVVVVLHIVIDIRWSFFRLPETSIPTTPASPEPAQHQA